MGLLSETLIGVWLAMTPPSEVEDAAERASRIATIARAVELEVEDDVTAALVAATVEQESGRLRADVHSGRRLGDNGRAICLGQVWTQLWLRFEEWRELAGVDLESTRRCVRAVVNVYKKTRCPTLEGSISTYATGKGCSYRWSGATKRLHLTWFYLHKIRKAKR